MRSIDLFDSQNLIFFMVSETSSSCLRWSLRCVWHLDYYNHWPLHQLDVKNTFLHRSLDEEMYMEQPLRFVIQGESDKVCRLKKSLYVLMYSLRAWFENFTIVLQAFGLWRYYNDYSSWFESLHTTNLTPKT